jgi:hypothetical protein
MLDQRLRRIPTGATPMNRNEWLDRLQEIRVELVKLPDSDPRKADLQVALNYFVEIEKTVTELDEFDPDKAEKVANAIVRKLKGKRLKAAKKSNRISRRRKAKDVTTSPWANIRYRNRTLSRPRR